MNKQIPFFKNYWNKEDITQVNKVIKRGMGWANGPEIEELEQQLAKLANVKYAILFNSGTSALFGMLACGDVRGKEVIVPSFTFISTANSVLHAGAKVVFADIEEDTFGLDPKEVEKKITKKTAAIMPVHYGGQICLIEELKKISDSHKLMLFEDAAESISSTLNNKQAGGIGDAGMFSFTPSKVISIGEGGVIVTNSKKMYQELKLFRSHGRQESEDYFTTTKYLDYIALGYGMRMSSATAAQGLAQLGHLKFVIEKRNKIAANYDKELSMIDEIILPKAVGKRQHIYQMYTIRVKDGRKRRNELQNFLKTKGIVTKVYFEPIHKTHFYQNVLGFKSKLPMTEIIADQVLSLPIYPDLTNFDQKRIIKSINHFFGK